MCSCTALLNLTQEDFEKVTQSKLDSKTHQALMLTICERCILGSAAKMAAAQKVLVERGKAGRETNGTATEEEEEEEGEESANGDEAGKDGEKELHSQLKTMKHSLSAGELGCSIRDRMIMESSEEREDGGGGGREIGEMEEGREEGREEGEGDKKNGVGEGGEAEEKKENGQVADEEVKEGREKGAEDGMVREGEKERESEVGMPECEHDCQTEEERVPGEARDGEEGATAEGVGGEERLAGDESSQRDSSREDTETEQMTKSETEPESVSREPESIGGGDAAAVTESTGNG